jgi:hypothetical protein
MKRRTMKIRKWLLLRLKAKTNALVARGGLRT